MTLLQMIHEVHLAWAGYLYSTDLPGVLIAQLAQWNGATL